MASPDHSGNRADEHNRPIPEAIGRLRSIVRYLTTNLSASVYAIMMIVVLALLFDFIPYPRVAFSFEVQTRAFNFRPATQIESGRMPVREVSLASPAGLLIDGTPLLGPATSDMTLTAAPEDSLTIDSLVIPAAWLVSVEGKPGGRFTLHADPPASAKQGAMAQITFITGERSILTRRFLSEHDDNRELGGDTEIGLTLPFVDIEVLPAADGMEIFDRVEPTALNLARIEKVVDANGRETVELVGEAESGTLWVDHNSEMPRNLGPLDEIEAKDITSGLLRRVALSGDAISFAAQGQAGSLINRPGQVATELRPSFLQVIIDAGILQIVIAVISFFAGLELSHFVRKRA